MTTLYYAPGACSLAPHIVLEWIGAPYRAEKVHFGSPELLALNPAGCVPILKEDDGWVLTQNSAILHYLMLKHPEAGIDGGKGPRAQAEAHRWAAFIASELHTSFWPLFRPSRFTTEQGDKAEAAVVEAAHAMVKKRLATMEEHMKGRQWMLDGGHSYVDAYCFPMLRWATAKLKDGLKPFPAVLALHDRIAANETVKKVLAAETAA